MSPLSFFLLEISAAVWYNIGAVQAGKLMTADENGGRMLNGIRPFFFKGSKEELGALPPTSRQG